MVIESRWLMVLGFLALSFAGAKTVVKYTQRGLRNNNPGNIRHGEPWVGMAETQDDPSFVTFATPEYGIRAMARVLTNYQQKYGINTVRQLISRWAPPEENDTESYIRSVAAQLGVDPNASINIAGALPVLIPAIVTHENGLNPYNAAQIQAGIRLA